MLKSIFYGIFFSVSSCSFPFSHLHGLLPKSWLITSIAISTANSKCINRSREICIENSLSIDSKRPFASMTQISWYRKAARKKILKRLSTPKNLRIFSLAKRHFLVWDLSGAILIWWKKQSHVCMCSPSRHYYIDETRLRFLNKKRKARRRTSKKCHRFCGATQALWGFSFIASAAS